MQRICGPFGFKNLFMPFERFLSTSMFFCRSIYIETALNFREECKECTDILSWRLSLCLSRDSVLWLSLTRSLYFIQVLILIPLIHSAPFLRFSHILLCTNFFICTLPCEIFFLFIPDDTARSATARNLISIFNFSSQRPQLNYTLLLTFIVLIQRNFPYNISANLFQFTNKASSHVAIV